MAGPELQISGDMTPPIDPPKTLVGAAYEDEGSNKRNKFVRYAIATAGLGGEVDTPSDGPILIQDGNGMIEEVYPGDSNA